MTLVHAETDLIRRAAALMKENAEAANSVEARRPYGDRRLSPVPESQWGALVDNYLGGPVGRHCASWSPGVAYAVADWLDTGADPNAGGRPLMLAVARAYLAGQGIEGPDVFGPRVDPARCTDEWHSRPGDPAGPCLVCGQEPFPFLPEAAEPGTIILYGASVVRRRPHHVIGAPWQSRKGHRYSHAEVRSMVNTDAKVTFCAACAGESFCTAHGSAVARPVHQIVDGSEVTGCCGKTTYEVRGDRRSRNPDHVTCRQRPGQGGPSGEGDDSE